MNALGKFEDQSHQKRAKFKLEKSKNSGKKMSLIREPVYF